MCTRALQLLHQGRQRSLISMNPPRVVSDHDESFDRNQYLRLVLDHSPRPRRRRRSSILSWCSRSVPELIIPIANSSKQEDSSEIYVIQCGVEDRWGYKSPASEIQAAHNQFLFLGGESYGLRVWSSAAGNNLQAVLAGVNISRILLYHAIPSSLANRECLDTLLLRLEKISFSVCLSLSLLLKTQNFMGNNRAGCMNSEIETPRSPLCSPIIHLTPFPWIVPTPHPPPGAATWRATTPRFTPSSGLLPVTWHGTTLATSRSLINSPSLCGHLGLSSSPPPSLSLSRSLSSSWFLSFSWWVLFLALRLHVFCKCRLCSCETKTIKRCHCLVVKRHRPKTPPRNLLGIPVTCLLWWLLATPFLSR